MLWEEGKTQASWHFAPAHDIAEFKLQFFLGGGFLSLCRDLRMGKRQTPSELLPVPWEMLDVHPSPGWWCRRCQDSFGHGAMLTPAFHPPLPRAMLGASAGQGYADGSIFQVHLDPHLPKEGQDRSHQLYNRLGSLTDFIYSPRVR